jgi:hypothetical protein
MGFVFGSVQWNAVTAPLESVTGVAGALTRIGSSN